MADSMSSSFKAGPRGRRLRRQIPWRSLLSCEARVLDGGTTSRTGIRSRDLPLSPGSGASNRQGPLAIGDRDHRDSRCSPSRNRPSAHKITSTQTLTASERVFCDCLDIVDEIPQQFSLSLFSTDELQRVRVRFKNNRGEPEHTQHAIQL